MVCTCMLGQLSAYAVAGDKRTPKLYSSGNNMDPGPIPTQLQVNTHLVEMSIITFNM